MKDKEKQIEEMAKDIVRMAGLDVYDKAEYLIKQGYRKLPEDSAVFTEREFLDECELQYNTGYQKALADIKKDGKVMLSMEELTEKYVPIDTFLLVKEELEFVKKQRDKHKLKIECLRETITWYDNDIKKISKETAEKILNEIRKFLIEREYRDMIFTDVVKEFLIQLAKRFGVEIKE